MDPFQNDTARATADRLRNPGARGPSPFEQFAKWATTPMATPPSRMKTPEQVMAPNPGVQGQGFRSVGVAPSPAAAPQAAHAVSARSPEEIRADISARPPITTDAGRALLKPEAMPSIGVQGAAPAQAQAHPAVPAAGRDPAREAMVAQYRHAASQARSGGQGQWVFPPGTGTEPVWMPNHSHDQAANYAQSLAQYDSGRAQFMQHDPAASIAKIDAINADPQRRSTALAMGGMNGAEQASLPDFSGGTIGGQATNEWLATHKDQELGGKLAAVPRDVSPVARAGIQRHVDAEYADPARWQSEASELPALSDYHYNGILPGLLAGPSNLASYLWDRTPFGGHERNAKPGVFEAMKRIGLHSPPGTVNAGIPPQ